MDPRDLRAYCERDWERAEAAKRRYWALRRRRLGPLSTLEASEALRLHLAALRPDWPTEADRAEDLRHHLELVDKRRRVAHVLGDL